MGKSPKPRVAHKSRADGEPPARREEVLETALTLVSEQGVAGASLRKLATELGISQPSLYHYFASKEALVSAVVEYCADKMLASSLDLPPPQRKEDIPRFAMRAYSHRSCPFSPTHRSPVARSILMRHGLRKP